MIRPFFSSQSFVSWEKINCLKCDSGGACRFERELRSEKKLDEDMVSEFGWLVDSRGTYMAPIRCKGYTNMGGKW